MIIVTEEQMYHRWK